MVLVDNTILAGGLTSKSSCIFYLFSEKQNLRDKKKENVFSKSVITSKWNRVKKVFSGKPESLIMKTESATAEQLVKANRFVKFRQSLSSHLTIVPHEKCLDLG